MTQGYHFWTLRHKHHWTTPFDSSVESSTIGSVVLLPVGLKLHKDKGTLNLQDISLKSQGKGGISIPRRLLSENIFARDPIGPRETG